MERTYAVVNEHMEEAKGMFAEGKNRFALLACRTGLEYLIKQLCKDSGISSSTANLDLKDMIDMIS